MRTWRLLFAVGMLAALLVPAKAATAKPHETIGDPQTNCAVNGSVELRDGVTPNNHLDHYEFVSTTLDCTGKKGGTYNVFAEGDTTDIWHGKGPKEPEGENCDQGGSTQIGDEYHTGDLNTIAPPPGSPPNPKELVGKVHFARLATVVLADGPLWDGTTISGPPDQFFQAELQFTPTEGTCQKNDPVKEALLTGTAQIFNSWTHDCSQESAKTAVKSDPHCDLP